MVISDFPAVIALWRQTEGIGLTESDSREGVSFFLRRNPDMSAVAVFPTGELAGTVLCGHDGRRGYMHHLTVVRSQRGRGIASRLIDWCFEHLAQEGIEKCNIFLLSSNESGALFWTHNGWSLRHDLKVFQKAVELRVKPHS
jgi:ribosomal protein S18 acetylase RimI-like enzyme